jgi:hypothetical protein
MKMLIPGFEILAIALRVQALQQLVEVACLDRPECHRIRFLSCDVEDVVAALAA